MSNTPIQDPVAQGLSSGSEQSLPCPPLQPISDPSASRRVCFYKSGDYKFSGHRMVINGRTFKTFDALLDTLSKKVPLAFGVRTITTPRGVHLVKSLDDLHDGGSYVCSDQKRVKPLNLNEVNRRQVPWNTTRPLSTGRQRRLQVRVTARVTVRTPKRLLVIKNKDPAVKRTIVLQRRTAPTFDSLLDYLSQILQFPVLKLFSPDGRRVSGLAALILCSGVVVAAGNEPFRLGNYIFHGTERYIVDQINKSLNGSTNDHLHHPNGSIETEVNPHHTSVETRGTGQVDNGHHSCVLPQDDDIEKSFRVNQDGSMTVEMKVRLTIKEEEMIHWTTTLSRHSLSKRAACASMSELGNSSPDSNNAIAKDSSSISEDDTKEENHLAEIGKGVCFNDKQVYKNHTSKASGKAKTSIQRTPTPGPRHIRKKASVESVKTVTGSGVQESSLGHYSYVERTADGDTTEGYCVVRHSSSSSKRPTPKPRKTASAGASDKVSRPSSSSNDCDIDFSRQPPTTGPLQRQKEEMLSLSSEPVSPTHEMTNNLSTVTEIDTQTAANSLIEDTVKRDKTPKSEKDKKTVKPARNQKSSTSKNSKPSSSEKLSSNASTGKKSLGSSESAKSGKKSKGAGKKVEKPQSKKSINDEDTPRTDSALLKKIENVKITPPKRQSANKIAAKDNGHNVNTPSGRPQMKKNMSDILQPKKSLLTGKKTASKPKTITANRTPTPKKALEFIESVSTPSLNPTPSEIHQYVENWLEKVSRDQVPYEEAVPVESEPPSNIAFQIGGESETDEKNGCQTNLDENYPPPGDAVKKSPSCLSVPLYHEGPETSLLHNDQKARGLCVSMPSVRLDPVSQENQLRAHRSAEAIGPTGSEATSSMSNILSPKETMTPVPRQLCTSVQNIRRASDTNTASNLEKSNSLPDFSTQVTSVFGSSCKAFVSFLSVMTLRDNITGSAQGDGGQSRSTSEAMLMMQSLLKISTLEDKEEQRASLTDLQSRTSSQFRERWKDFQILRERLESEPLSPSVSETEFALDLASEGGDIFEDQQLTIDELMEELNMPQDLRAEISSTIQQARSFYPVEESTFVENERNQSDSEEDVEKFPDNARAVQTKLNVIPKRRKDSSYGLKCLPSPNTSDLSDYRPETSESGGYKTQDSLDIVTDSGDEASERPSPVVHVNRIPNGGTNTVQALASSAEVSRSSRIKSAESFCSNDSGTKVSKEDLSYFSAASSLKADVEAAPEATQCISHSSDKDTADGVLIDRGRWLLKENHLIRKSPPISLGMYGDADSTSTDTGQENIGEDSPAHCKTRHNPLVAISSSELEEMAKPQTPKCSYFNMPHGSDSDPFMEDSIGHGGKRDTSSVKGRGFRVSPSIDTYPKMYPNKVGSMSSFASVEFKIPDGKVHPEGEPSAVTQPRRTSSGGGSVVQVHDSLETLRVRCGQYCPIL
uniref:Doublecortin domain-containing protein n=1 Tax=Scophthalmus maximus TaxID=52904 RepID=A0A8D3C9J8_SCOMX